MYNGSDHVLLDLPHFNSYFSSFLIDQHYLYYWGYNSEFGMMACRYDLQTKETKELYLGEGIGTDFFGVWDPPVKTERGNILFRLENGDKWIVNQSCSKVLKKQIRVIPLFEEEEMPEDELESQNESVEVG